MKRVLLTKNALNIIVILLQYVFVADCKFCSVPEVDGRETNQNNWTEPAVSYLCPGSRFPEGFTECCGEGKDERCCPPARDRHFYEIDNRLAMIIAGSVISICVTVGLLVIVCCFWSKCPLYNTCRAHYVESEVGLYEKEDMAGQNAMPPEPTNKSKNSYLPNDVNNEK